MRRNKNGRKKGVPKGEKKRNSELTKALVYLYVAYLVIIMITKVIPIMADQYIDSVQNDMVDEYSEYMRFSKDGYNRPYYVERWNTSAYAIIDMTYYTPTHTLEVELANVKVLGIDCRALYEDKCEKITGRNPDDDPQLFKKYFIERDLFTVHIVTLDNRPMLNLSFKDTPIAHEVRVNGEKWYEGVDYVYTSDYGMVIGNVPSGSTNVEIWFKSPGSTGPTAVVVDDEIVAWVNESITFDATPSYDDIGIENYYWDFGEGNFTAETNPTTTFSYPKEGGYIVILTVRDTDSNIDRAFINVTVVPYPANTAPEIMGVIPNQEKDEDCPPWTLNLSGYGFDFEDSISELRWFITGENTSLYTVVGENTTDGLTFIPVQNAYGNDEVTLWLMDSEGAFDSQKLWINITSINDKPYFHPSPPNLIVHYYDPEISEEDPYTWDYTAYVHDVETQISDLILTTSEDTTDLGKGCIKVDGMEATFIYPYSMLGKSIPVKLMLSDREDETSTMIAVTISSNWAPRLVDILPDITLPENSSLINAFDLDDYFWDRDNDTLFYATGNSNVDIIINENHTVDFNAPENWFGTEYVTFRATDPTGAIIEDTIVITVIPVNDPPTIAGVPDISVRFDQTYAFDLSPYVEDNDNSTDDLLIWTTEPQANIWVSTSSNLILMFNYPEARNGSTIPVSIWVSDGIDSNYQSILVKVSDNYPPELIWNLPDVTFKEDEYLNNSFNLSYYFLDMDGNILYYTYGYTNIFINVNENHTVDFHAAPDWNGFEKVTFRATDAKGALVEDTILVTVIPVNDAPVIGNIPDQWAEKGDTWVLDLSIYLSDVDNEQNELEVTVQSLEGEQYIQVSGFFLIFQYPEDVNKDTVTVIVSDGVSNSSREFSVTIGSVKPKPSYWSENLWLWVLLIAICVIIAELIAYRVLIYGKFIVQEVFLIHENGLLIAHSTTRTLDKIDDVKQSGMLIAGMNLIRDSFSETEDTSAPKRLEVMGQYLIAERGKRVYILVVHTGDVKKRALEKIKNVIRNIEERYAEPLENWQGDVEELEGIDNYLKALL